MLAWNGYGQTANGGFFAGLWGRIAELSATPVFLLIAVAFCLGFVHTAEISSKSRRRWVGLAHGTVHLAILLFGSSLVSVTLGHFQVSSVPVIGDILYFLALLAGMLIVGVAGAFVWGLYLAVASFAWGDESNSAFSALVLDSYRLFLRLKIEGDELTIHPIGIDESPERAD